MNQGDEPEDEEFDAEFCLVEHEREFIETLARGSVQYVLLGGHAVNFYGHRRCVGDMDILIDRSPENVSRLTHALHGIGIQLPAESIEKLTESNKRLTIPRSEIDILTSVEPLFFEDLFQERLLVEYETLTLPMISKNHLLALKKASDRKRDKADYAALAGQEMHGQPGREGGRE